MGNRASGPLVLLLAIVVIMAMGACLVHLDDQGSPDACASLLAVTFGVMLAIALYRAPSIIVARVDAYRPVALQPPAPPPRP